MRKLLAGILIIGVTLSQGTLSCLAASAEALGQTVPSTEFSTEIPGETKGQVVDTESMDPVGDAENTEQVNDSEPNQTQSTEQPEDEESPETTEKQETEKQETELPDTENTESGGQNPMPDEAGATEEVEPTEEVGPTEEAEPTEDVESTESLETELPELESTEDQKGASYSVSGAQIVVNAVSGEDITKVLDDALKDARDLATDAAPITVVLPSGTYKLSNNLHIYSNTVLDLGGSTIQYVGTESHNMLLAGTNGSYNGQANYNESAACSGYGGFRNITIKNGTWQSSDTNTSTIVRVAHATNVIFEKLVFTGGACEHQVEVAAIDGFYVRDCTFKDFGKTGTDTSDKNKQEALQLDIPCHSDVFKAYYADGTPMKNVEITGCTFANVPRGVGTHTMLYGAYHENIKINNNVFTNVLEEAIVGLGYYNCEIKGNQINDCGAGILFQYFKKSDDSASIYTTIFDGKQPYTGAIRNDAATEISGNTIKTKYSVTCSEIQGIKVEGRYLAKDVRGGDKKIVPAGDYYISGVVIKDNPSIVTAGFGIHMINARNSAVMNNANIQSSGVSSKDPEKDKYDGIFIEDRSANIAVTGNGISNMPRNGIFVQESANVSEVTGNTIANCAAKGINFFNNSGSTGAISGNVISGCGNGGILVSTGSAAGDIAGNQIAGVSGDAGITVYKNSTVGNIADNVITNMGTDADKNYCHGIKLTTEAASGTISGNQILKGSGKYAAGNGVLVYNKSKVNGAITANTVQKTADIAVSVSTSSTVSGDISSNNIASTDKSGIFVYKSSKVGGDISSNTITTAKENGIYITGSATVKGGIVSNKISSTGGKGIFVFDKSKKTTVGSIKNNTIKKAKSQGINVSSTKNNLMISGNKLSSGSDNAIIIQPNTTKYTVTVKGNTIKGNKKKSGVRVVSGKISVMDNTISNVAYGVYTDKGVKGSVYNNKFGSKVSTQLAIGGSNRKQTTGKIAVSSVKSSAKKNATVSWKKASGVDGYEVQYSTSKDFSKSVKNKAVKSDKTSVKLTGLSSKKTYYVRVLSYKTVNGVKIYSNYGKAKSVKVK